MTTKISSRFEDLLEMRAAEVQARLVLALAGHELTGEISRPKRLLAAMRHGVLNGGKRLRPFLVLESAALFTTRPNPARAEDGLTVATALECVHCYSLIHDDLPAMDDDDLRRGRPTVHKAFDEATAILAGDALLTLAFDLIAGADASLSERQRLDLIAGLARAAGPGGMVGGQMMDLEAETRKPDEAGIIRLQAMKTGALIRYACEAGAIISGASSSERERLAEFGSAIGLAFQLADDLLDRSATPEAMGKATGKDAAAGKGTLVGLHGENWARHQLTGLVEQAEDLLAPYGEKAGILKAAARFVAERGR
jgi:farnesyl diphosphate synthase